MTAIPETVPSVNTYRAGPDEDGHFGPYGGRYVAETLMPLILEVEKAYRKVQDDPCFHAELKHYLAHYVGRPSPLYFAERLTEYLGGARIYFKRDELNHTGAHKINNCVGQILLARMMGKTRIIAETGAGQHGVATATVCALFNLPCTVYMGETDIARQQPNVFRMKLLGAEVKPVTSGSRTLKDAMNEALRDWVANVDNTYYLIGTVAGPHPYPMMVRDFQAVIGQEVRAQMMEAEGRPPDSLVACIGGGSNAMGLFHPFLDDPDVTMHAVEAAGHGLDSGKHAASLTGGRPGVLHGNKTYLLQDHDGQIQEAHSISAGLDYPGIGPEHAWLFDTGRVRYVSITDAEALDAFQLCAKMEGIIPALEPAHALAHVIRIAGDLPREHLLVMNMCGRGDKDIFTVASALGVEILMESRIDRRFEALRAEGRGGLITFITAGDPDLESSFRLMRGLPGAGADLIELGMPFSDPMADGPSIQAANLRALKAGITLSKTLDLVRRFRETDNDTPIVLMGYFNPIHTYGVDRFLRDARSVGVDGLIIVDLPPEEDRELCLPALATGMRFIRLATPTTDDHRLPVVLANTNGFLYFVAITGITGTRSATEESVSGAVARLRHHTGLPIAVGFGIKTPENAAMIVRFADAAVVGSAIVDRIAAGLGPDGRPTADMEAEVLGFVGSLAAAIRATPRQAA